MAVPLDVATKALATVLLQDAMLLHTPRGQTTMSVSIVVVPADSKDVMAAATYDGHEPMLPAVNRVFLFPCIGRRI